MHREKNLLIIPDCTSKCEKNGRKAEKTTIVLSIVETTGHKEINKL